MKTEVKNIIIEFSLNICDSERLKLELSENAAKNLNSFIIIAKGILLDSYYKNLKTQIIFIN